MNGLRAANPGVNIFSVDINSLFERITAEPSRFGLTNTTNSCVVGNFANVTSICDQPNNFLFYDDVHPTTGVHNLIARQTLATIEGKSIPEPSAAIAILGVGVLALASRSKRS
ncbi:MAG: PEP-CTERM sorting domain-containing protein [Calothrix sp. SM1_7_51]|nr:PEP-CTERM sorting domain-containing protein [Calothrix sp. SM1_7_51]